MKAIVGLGNPGSQYERTRHNVGFRVLDLLATTAGAEFKAVKNFEGAAVKAQLAGKDVILLKPLTYMNLSGRATAAVINWFKLPLSELLVIHDDVSLPLGRIRVQSGGGAGGQHGIESIISCLGNKKEFDRIKVGVGPDPGGDRRADFVLSGVRPEDVELLETVLQKSRDAVVSWLQKGAKETMNFYNGQIFGRPFGFEDPPGDGDRPVV